MSATSGAELAAGNVPALIVIRLPDDHTMDPRPRRLSLPRLLRGGQRPGAGAYRGISCRKRPSGKTPPCLSPKTTRRTASTTWTRIAASCWWPVPGSSPARCRIEHTSMGSITRTIDELLGLGPLNLEDALAGEIAGIFDTPAAFRELHESARRSARLRCRQGQAGQPKTKGRLRPCAMWTTPTRFERRWRNRPRNCASRTMPIRFHCL